MPRIAPSIFWRARHISPCATLLLPACRDLPSSLAELRWIRQHVAVSRADGGQPRRAIVQRLCRRRGRGEPLQYVLGTQPFGPLDLLCRRGVLIPRPEPEAYSLFLADWLMRPEIGPVSTILDVCTGTGCIALLLYERLRQQQHLRVVGIDVSPAAVALARANRRRLGFPSDRDGTDSSSVSFHRADVFADDWLHLASNAADGRIDVLVCNPPYVSRDGFAHETARSVRLFEPKLAQVPLATDERDEREDHHEDIFYGRLLDLAVRLDPRSVLLEVGGLDQAQRVVEAVLAGRGGPVADVEIWADCPDIPGTNERRTVNVVGRSVLVRGSGHGRSVFVRRRV
ncbi:mitochondrial n-glutamine methyltransferase mtq1 [Grosmannia clavigera kw1407]|uniref:Mitochondrial n-glutamine methyltransferase mtq1 n=1 Tax=Grosmannia clavigera (strain kw1407 / UAMH 11150) TaxID=655863 RepID=F0XFT2_GROCL|nr:mitochondrial n-glutamine methyltransferase mtq1 [Grosmannia clavigera kw1407]EFX04663.1 mitochondrial n-glutamine methyltransferase mtq1 [Grosmannia clavigera kw1407]